MNGKDYTSATNRIQAFSRIAHAFIEKNNPPAPSKFDKLKTGPLYNAQSCIDEIEKVKKILTLTQCALEDNNWQEAGDTICAVVNRYYSLAEFINKIYNITKKEDYEPIN